MRPSMAQARFRWPWLLFAMSTVDSTQAFRHAVGWRRYSTRFRPRTSLTSTSPDCAAEQSDENESVRKQMLGKALRRSAHRQERQQLRRTARKGKLKRHDLRRYNEERSLTDEERQSRRHAQLRVQGWLDDIYEMDSDLTKALVPRLRVAVDLAYVTPINDYGSLGRQLACAYGLMRKVESQHNIPSLHLTSATGPVMDAVSLVGVHNYRVRKHVQSVFEVFPAESLVYLSPDSSNVLEELLPTKIYVIGGLVDRTVARNMSFSRAAQHGVTTARLPLKEFFSARPSGAKYLSSQCLPVDRVLQILMAFYRLKSWPNALDEVFPKCALSKESCAGRVGDGPLPPS